MIFVKEKIWTDAEEHTVAFLMANNLSHMVYNGLNVSGAIINDFHLLTA